VTGASSGLGRRAALALAGGGAKVVGVARRAEALASPCGRAPGPVRLRPGDLADRDGLAATTAAQAPRLSARPTSCHAAGHQHPRTGRRGHARGLGRHAGLNLSAPFFLAQALVPAMKARAGAGSSISPRCNRFRAFPGGIAYGASKGGVAQLTRAMAEAWSRDGITANAIGPGFFPTELTAAVFADPERAARNAAQTCIGRNGEPEDIDGPLLFLCSEASATSPGRS
jgi:NAD(P)-dependent dehydrogenase (short-subunit alcohol dehydrogenase family)